MQALIDDFRVQASAIRRRRRRRRVSGFLRLLMPLCLIAVVAAAVWSGRLDDLLQNDDAVTAETLAIPEGGDQSSEASFEIEAADKMRDPVIFAQDQAATTANKRQIQFQRTAAAIQMTGNLYYVSDRMMDQSVQLMAALPATPQDFALMGSASVDERSPQQSDQQLGAQNQSTFEEVDAPAGADDLDAAGWSDLPAGAGDDESAEPPRATAEAPPPSMEMAGTSTFTALAADQRAPAAREHVVKVLFQRSLDSVLQEAGLGPQATRAATEAAARLLNITQLQPGYVAAFRVDAFHAGAYTAPTQAIIQLTVVSEHGTIGSIALDETGTYQTGEDAFSGVGLEVYAEKQINTGSQRFRLMDGLYAAGVRNGIPQQALSEMMMLMARQYNLGAFMQPNDRFVVIYMEGPRDQVRDTGRVLYVSIRTGGDALTCYVQKPGRDSDYACMTGKDSVTQKLGPAGFVIPVQGVLRSTFGPRKHPILGVVRNHNGVDWAAPPGTPIHAAFDGTIEFAGVKGGFGNFVRIAHPNGFGTGYGHMKAFADGIVPGKQVKAGDLIGYVGTTGLSTGPHLHFELYVDNVAVDPLSYQQTQVAAAAVSSDDDSGGSQDHEVDKLIARIIKVESGGNPNAKAPTSSAAGLGQFISTTWMRMIRSYRPDLMSSMSAQEILDLRFDATMSKEMLYNLASENEADIKRAGFHATAGNLYLAHFLGSAGAIKVLAADPGAPIGDVVGYGVVSANGFLRGRDAQWTIDWAAKKMTGKGVTMVATRSISPEIRIKDARFAAYSKSIDEILSAAGGA